jgi:tetratricopeptide (TPR) repeat protein
VRVGRIHPSYRLGPTYPILAKEKHYGHCLATLTVTRLNRLESPQMSSESLTVDLRELDWELLDSTDGLSDDEVLDLCSVFLIEQFHKMGAEAETELVSDLQMSVSWHPGIDTKKVLVQSRDLLNQGEVKRAASMLWTVLRIETIPKEDFVDGMFLLGSAYSLLDRHDDAVSVLEVTLECDPDHFLAMSSLGYAELVHGNPNLAEEWFRKSIAIEPENQWALKNLGICLTNQRRFADAQVELRRCLELTPDDVALSVSLGQCLHHLGDLRGAKESFERAITLSGPEHLQSMARDYLAKYEKDAERTGDDFNEVAYGYMLDALDRLSCVDRELKRAVVIELVLLAAKGIAINDLETKHRLRTVEGEFDGLYLACLFYAAAQEVTPGEDIGIDFSREYQKAKEKK